MKTITVDEIFSKLAINGVDQNQIDLVTDLLDNLGIESINGDTVLSEKDAKKIGLYFNVDLFESDKPKKVKREKKEVADIVINHPVETAKEEIKEETKQSEPVEEVEDKPQFNDDCELLNEKSSNIHLTDVYVTRIKAVMLLMAYDLTKLNEGQVLFEMLFDEECHHKHYTYQNDYCLELVNGVLDNFKKINTIIAFNLKNYTFDRLNSVDRAIIRIAVWEMAFKQTPKSIVIDTALNLTKEYSDIDGKQVKFNNRLLDNIATFLEEQGYGK